MVIQKGSHQLMQQLNKSLILDLIKADGPIARVELAKKTKLSNPAVSAIISLLLEEGWIEEIGVAKSTGGRPARLLKFNSRAGFLIGVDIGGTKMAGAAVDLAGNILERRTIASKDKECLSKKGSIDKLIALISDLRSAVGSSSGSFKGIGLGIPGVTDAKGQRVRLAPGIGWENVDIGGVLTKRFGVPLFADNDANCFARGEFWQGSLRGTQCGIAVTIGTGIGVGIVMNGQIYQGANNAAGEVGYWLLGNIDLIEKNHGYGPLESVASGAGMANRAYKDLLDGKIVTTLRDRVENDLTRLTAQHIFEEAKQGDAYALWLVEETTTLLGILIANMASLLNVEKIVIGGGVSRAGEQLLRPLKSITEKLAPYVPEIAISQSPEDTAILGAVAGVLEQSANLISYSSLM